MTPEQIDAELTKCEAATAGPWFQWTTSGDVSSEPLDCFILETLWRDDEGQATAQGNADCAFIVSARTGYPAALRELRTLQQRLAEAEAACQVFQQKNVTLESERDGREFCCQANRTADPPQDCGFPTCGCSRIASEAVESLVESGWLDTNEASELRQRAELAEQRLEEAERERPTFDYPNAAGVWRRSDLFIIVVDSKESHLSNPRQRMLATFPSGHRCTVDGLTPNGWQPVITTP